MATKFRTGTCRLCGRVTELTFHHLIPRKLHRRSRFRKHYSHAALLEGIELCRLCHKGLHRLYDEMTLARHLSTLSALRRDPKIQRHVAWVRKQRAGLSDG